MQEHPSKLILGWMGHLIAPEWDDKKSYNNCYHCSQRFQIGHQHHCRLCGHMFCSMCTAKYLVSSQFKRKDKDGPDRVCFGCRNQCLERRAKFIKNEPPLKPQMALAYDNAGVMHIYPPVWAKAGSYMNCKLCHEMLIKGNTHHCRACGEMFDKNCTTKLEVPQAFRKKPKNGPCRICFECRYHILSGRALLDERPISALNSDLSLLNNETMVPSAKLLSVAILWEDTNEKPIATINVVGHCNLEEVNTRLLRSVPEMKKVDYTYICRGRPIFKEHWGVFNAEFIHPQIVIRQGTLEVLPDDQPELNRNATPAGNNKQLNAASPRPAPKTLALQTSFETDRSRRAPENGNAQSILSRATSAQSKGPSKPLTIELTQDVPVNQLERTGSTITTRVAAKQDTVDKFEDKSPEPLEHLNLHKFDLSDNDHGDKLASTPTDTKMRDGKISVSEDALPSGSYLLVRSRYDFKTDKATLLSCAADENLIIIKRPERSGWWLAQNALKQKGWVPARYMQVLHEYTQASDKANLSTTLAKEIE